MSILARELARATSAGINPNAPCDARGMAMILTSLDLANRLTYKPGMAELWADSMALWCTKHHRKAFTYVELAAAVLDMTTEAGSGFSQPAELWRAVGAFQADQVRNALAHRKEAPLPEIEEPWTGERSQAYQAAWRRAVLHGATTDKAREQLALEACQLTPAKPARQLTKNVQEIAATALKTI